MTLTRAGGPLSVPPPETVNYRIDGPAGRLLFTPFPRRVRGEFADVTVLDTTRGQLLHETGLLPQLYVPRADVREDLLRPTEHHTHCPYKGDAAYWSITVDGRTAENALWAYPDPLPAAPWLRGYVAAYWHALDHWFDEDEQVRGHLRDPYTRVDTRATSRPVRVEVAGEVLAETRSAVLLSETGLPNRFYLPVEDLPAGRLEPSDTTTHCPYKGDTRYWHLRTDAGLVRDAAWSYPEPYAGVQAIRGRLCFDPAAATTLVDDKPVG